ncbi:MAG: ATP-dependent helicase RecG, partial [Bacteroidota bacterium]|nr:ATP-dependent helicase RecG [Bacteroidota bacterium]
GQMFWYEKEEEMKSFLAKESDIMVATTVIEVGIDIPNATVMIIENAERFGLSQLHQLRGRVGRGSEQSYCFLMTKDHYQYQLKKKDDETERTASIIRLRTMQETCDGFKISEVDLKLRGPGDLLGTRQTGLPEFKYADIINDLDLISLSRNIAFDLIEKDPHLRLPQNAEVKTQYYKKYGFGKSYFDIA